jgi:hypothetical protein
MKSKLILIVLLCGSAIGAYFFNRSTNPPKESKLIESFNQHRPDYETLRNMFQADEKLMTIAEWGVETSNTPPTVIAEIPPEGGFPVSRFHQYLSLLEAIHAKGCSRIRTPQEIRVLIWGSGFAGDTRHVAVSWVEKAPENQVTNLDTFYKSPKPRKPMYRHIDGNWYLWADW